MHLRARKLTTRDLLVQKARFEALDAACFFIPLPRAAMLVVRDGLFHLGYLTREVCARVLSGDTSDLAPIARDLTRYVGAVRGRFDLYDEERVDCPYRQMRHNVSVYFQRTYSVLAYFEAEKPRRAVPLQFMLPGDIVFYSSRLSHQGPRCSMVRYREGLRMTERMRMRYLRKVYEEQSPGRLDGLKRVKGRLRWG